MATRKRTEKAKVEFSNEKGEKITIDLTRNKKGTTFKMDLGVYTGDENEFHADVAALFVDLLKG